MTQKEVVYETDLETLFLKEQFPYRDPWKNIKVLKEGSIYEVWVCHDYVNGTQMRRKQSTHNTFEEAKRTARQLIGLETNLEDAENQKSP